MNKQGDPKQQSFGSIGAMQNAPGNGVATDPQQVQSQQGDTSKASPGTVGAAPAADTKSSNLANKMLCYGYGLRFDSL